MLLRIRLWAPTWCRVAAQHFAFGPLEQLLYTSTVCLAVSCLDGHSDLGLRLTKTGSYWTGFVTSVQEGDISSGLREPGHLDSSAIHMLVSLLPTLDFQIPVASFVWLLPTLGTIRPLSRPISVI